MEDLKFNNLLKSHEKQIKGIARKHTSGNSFPFSDMESILIEEFWNCCKDFDSKKDTKLKTYTEKRLNNKALDVRKTRYFKDFDENILLKEYGNEESDKDAATFDVTFRHITDRHGVEDEVIYGKEKDQLNELILYLTDPTKVKDPITTAIVKEFLEVDNPNPTAIGKKLGLHHFTVIRKLRKLADNYDEIQFGNYRRYLAG